jgi:hypothetical protein
MHCRIGRENAKCVAADIAIYSDIKFFKDAENESMGAPFAESWRAPG